MKLPFALTAAILFSMAGLAAAQAGEADIVDATAHRIGGGWTFDVTVAHADTGWDHYADAWEVVGTDGTIYGTRELLHPHENEQPFTRSLSGVVIPDQVKEVIIRARDSVHDYGGKEFRLKLDR